MSCTSLVKCRGASRWQVDDVTDASDSDAAPADFRPRRSYRPGRWRRLENSVMCWQADHLLRDPRELVTDTGFDISEAEQVGIGDSPEQCWPPQ